MKLSVVWDTSKLREPQRTEQATQMLNDFLYQLWPTFFATPSYFALLEILTKTKVTIVLFSAPFVASVWTKSEVVFCCFFVSGAWRGIQTIRVQNSNNGSAQFLSQDQWIIWPIDQNDRTSSGQGLFSTWKLYSQWAPSRLPGRSVFGDPLRFGFNFNLARFRTSQTVLHSFQ